MKLTITHLKAPWPAGAKVGDVIELPAVPVWAVGKCKPAADDDEVTVAAGEAPPLADPLEALRAEATAFIDRQRAEHAQQVAELQAKLDAADAKVAGLELANKQLSADLDAATAAKAELQAKLDAAGTKTKKA